MLFIALLLFWKKTDTNLCKENQVLWSKEEWLKHNTEAAKHAVPKKQAIAMGKKVFVERKIVKYRVKIDSPSYEIIQLYQSNKFPLYGTVAGKPPNSKLYKVQLDLLPSDCNEILVVQKDITVLAKGEEEPPYDPHHGNC